MERKAGIIAGTGFYDFPGLFEKEERTVETPHGTVEVMSGKIGPWRVFFVPRHRKDHSVPPHMVNFRANMYVFKDLGAEFVIGVNSVGSLKKEIIPGTLVIPHDFISLFRVDTYFDTEVVHAVPSLDAGLRKRLVEKGRELGLPIRDEGVYFQTLGPRLETRAEVKMIKNFADVVGMNMGSEAALASELGIPFANISSVDNYAHGIGNEKLSFEEIVRRAKENHQNTILLIKKLLTEWEEEPGPAGGEKKVIR